MINAEKMNVKIAKSVRIVILINAILSVNRRINANYVN